MWVFLDYQQDGAVHHGEREGFCSCGIWDSFQEAGYVLEESLRNTRTFEKSAHVVYQLVA